MKAADIRRLRRLADHAHKTADLYADAEMRGLIAENWDTLGGSIQWDLHPGTPDRRVDRWVWVMIGVCILIIAGISIARAAEPASEPHVITIYFAGKDYDAVERTHRVLAVYDSREECRVMITRVRVHVSGARLVCAPVETRRVK